MLTTFLQSSLSLISRMKFYAMCLMQYACEDKGYCHLFLGSLYAFFIDSCPSDINHILTWGVTYILKFLRKKLQSTFASHSTNVKAIVIFLSFPYCATTIKNSLYTYHTTMFRKLVKWAYNMQNRRYMVGTLKKDNERSGALRVVFHHLCRQGLQF